MRKCVEVLSAGPEGPPSPWPRPACPAQRCALPYGWCEQLRAGGLFWTPQRPHTPVPRGLGPAWKSQHGPAQPCLSWLAGLGFPCFAVLG